MPPPRRKTGAAIASSIFVDRELPKRTFEKAAFAIPARGCSLRTWYGVGGQGKTALARELFRISDAGYEPSYAHLRRAMLDLHGRPVNDPDRLLVWIRNAFSGAGIAFPAFDLAFAIMWQKTRGEEPLPAFDNPWLYRTGQAFSATVPDAISLTRGLVDELSGTIPGLGFLISQGTKWVFSKGKRAWLDRTRPQLEAFYRDGRLIEDHEMPALMAWMLAQDLNQHLADHPDERFVLFVDEYERVMEGAGTGARWRENTFDAHMRSFVAETDGLLALFFSRERLHWEDDPDWRASLDGHQHLLGGLSDKDAEKWLLAAPINDAAIRTAIVQGARETPEPASPVYPLMLDLQVEHWRNLGDRATPADFTVAAAGFEARRRELVGRLLRDYDDAVQDALSRLALTSRFDRLAFEHVVTSFNLPLPFGAFDKLAALSIVSSDEEGWLSLHRAIADAIVQSVAITGRSDTRSVLRAHFEQRAMPGRPADVTEETLACFTEAAGLRLQEGHEGYADWLQDASEMIRDAWRPAFLERIWRDALDIASDLSGPAHPDTATCLSNLALCLGSQGREAEAGPLLRQALWVRQNALGEADARTGESYSNLASSLTASGQYEEAGVLHHKGLEIRLAALGESHPDTAQSYDNIASNLDCQARYSDAEPLYRKGLEIRRAAFGEMHQDTCISYNNTALNLFEQGRFEEAGVLYRKSLEISLAINGAGHPETATQYNNLASNFQSIGCLEEAEPLYRKSLEIARKALGETHPDTATGYNNLGACLSSQGHSDQALELYRKALDIRRVVLGERHPDTAESYNNIGYILSHQQNQGEAIPLYQRCLETRRAVLGEDHPDTVAACANLALCLNAAGRYEEAEPLDREVLQARLSAHGENHPATAAAYSALAFNLEDQGRRKDARLLFQKELGILRDVLGDAHPDTADSYVNLGFSFETEGRFDTAEPYFRKALHIRQNAEGVSHAALGLACINVAANCLARERVEEAAGFYEKALLALDHPDCDPALVQMARDGFDACADEVDE